MKKFQFKLLFIALSLLPVACNRLLPIGPLPVPAPTPTPNMTPVCGFTPLPNTTNLDISGTRFVIQNQTEWTNVNGPGTALPPVDFSNQMILELSQGITCSCMCSPVPPAITSVCHYPSYIEVNYQSGGVSCPPPPGYMCNSEFWTNYQSMVTVPQSNLPVSWVAQ
jgi:hypothetical protein